MPSSAKPAATGTPTPPAPPDPVAPPAPSFRPASEATDPAVHRLLFERQAAMNPGALELIAEQLAELGYV